MVRKCTGCWEPLGEMVQRCPNCGRVNRLPTPENIVFSAPKKVYDLGIEKKYHPVARNPEQKRSRHYIVGKRRMAEKKQMVENATPGRKNNQKLERKPSTPVDSNHHCPKCSKMFKSEIAVQSHIKDKHSKPIKNLEGKQVKKRINKSRPSKRPTVFQCLYCGKKFKSKMLFQNHINLSHRPERKPSKVSNKKRKQKQKKKRPLSPRNKVPLDFVQFLKKYAPVKKK